MFYKTDAYKKVPRNKETPAQGFYCKFCEDVKKTFFHNTTEWLLLQDGFRH